MTPQEFLRIQSEQWCIISEAQKKISDAREAAGQCPLPSNLRPATASDIQEDAVIWYPRWENRNGGWCVVEEVRHPGDAFKAFVADDGCRYGLDGAFVEEAPIREGGK